MEQSDHVNILQDFTKSCPELQNCCTAQFTELRDRSS